MFYDIFLKLCDIKHVSRTKACIDCDVSRTAWRKWINGGIPNGTTLSAFAEYFGVTTDYLLGTEKEKTPTTEGERPVTFDDFTYAMYEEGKELTAENKKKLLEMAQFFRQQQEKDKQK